MYYTHYGYQTSIFGKNCAYYIRIYVRDSWAKDPDNTISTLNSTSR